MKKYIITETQLKKIVSRSINEQQVSTEDKEVQKIAYAIYRASKGGGTNNNKFIEAIKSIKSYDQYKKVDEFFKSKKSNSIAFYINDEFGIDTVDAKSVSDISAHLKSVGVPIKYTGLKPSIGSKGQRIGNSFRGGFTIGTPSSTNQPSEARQGNINMVYCSAGGNASSNITKGKGWVGKPLSEYIKRYQVTQEEMVIAQKYCISQGEKGLKENKRQDNINLVYCSLSEDNVMMKGSLKGQPWNVYIQKYNVTEKEMEVASKTCKKNTNKTQFTLNESFPLKFGQKGKKIRALQLWLGIPKNKATGNFHNLTESLIKKQLNAIGWDYVRGVGLTEEAYNDIVAKRKKVVAPKVNKFDEPTPEELVALSGTPAGINTNVNQPEIDQRIAGL